MAYTGTGTESDPYLVSTLSDFISRVGVSGAYVKVISNIDAREEQEYPTVSTIYFRAKKIYADTLTKVSGFIVSGANCFNVNPGHAIAIENIHFTDILYKSTGNYSTVMYGYSCTFTDCKISIKTSYSPSQGLTCLLGCTFRRCALRFDFEGTGTGYDTNSPFGGSVYFAQSVVEINNYPYRYTSSSSSTYEWYAYAEFSVFKISFIQIIDNSARIYVFLSRSHDNIIMISQQHLESTFRYWHSILVNGTSMLVDSEASENVGERLSFSDTGARNHKLTTEQIQSEEYLREIGFIP